MAREAPTGEQLQDVFAEPGDDAVLAALVASLPPLTPRPGSRAALLDAAEGRGRLHRFAETLATLIDVSLDKARELLDRVADPSRWEKDLFPGLDALWVEGGPAATQCIRGFARLAAGKEFPQHGHFGDETTFVLEGAMIESSGKVIRPGETLSMHAGSDHRYRAAEGGTDLLFFVVARNGINFADGAELRHRDS